MAEQRMPVGFERRREDERLITGRGQYVDDLHSPAGRPAPLIMSVVRSPYAHARIGAIDSEQAAALPGGVAFELPIVRIEGKFKLSQNRDATDRAQVDDHLAASESQDERAVAAAMRALGVAPSR